ncbi:unnamed protein product, partial [marine sediment metagenome]
PEMFKSVPELCGLALVLFAITASRLVMEPPAADKGEAAAAPASNVPAGAPPLPEVAS